MARPLLQRWQGKGNGVCEKSPPKLKTFSSFSLSSSRPSSSRPSVGEKSDSKDYFDGPSGKMSKSSFPSSLPLRKLFANLMERLYESHLTSLPGFMAKVADFVFCFFNQAWESWSESLTTRYWPLVI
ncbi:hypothetical protein Fot_35150 [Forsythia ovata]|uniref:Uncharacterized protein n=1 Tax=Forsythia ovata TaxID=205694 RepID=A0ABD1SKQ2_9LAMI